MKAPEYYTATTWNTKSATRAQITFYDPLINGDYFFSLSAREVLSAFADAEDGHTTWNGNKKNIAHWLLRFFNLALAQSVCFYSVNASTSATNPRFEFYIASTYPELARIGVRTTMVLNPPMSYFFSTLLRKQVESKDIDGTFNSSKWSSLYDADSDVWKMPLLDDASMSISFKIGEAVLDKSTRIVTIPHSGANSGRTGFYYISGILPGGYYTRFARFK